MIPFITDLFENLSDMFTKWNEDGYLTIAIIILALILLFIAFRH